MARTVVLNSNPKHFDHAIDKRIPVNQNATESYDLLENALIDAEKSWVTEKIENVNVIELEDESGNHRMGLDVNGKLLPLHGSGITSLYDQFKLTGLVSALNVIPDEIRANEIRDEILEAVMKDKKNMNLRFHTADFGGQQEIMHIASTRHDVKSELELFREIRQAAEPRNYVPIRVFADLEKVRVQMVQVDETFELDPVGMGAHAFIGSKKDKFLGMLTATLSETSAANEVVTGVYREICTNGAILGAQEDLSLRAIRGAKATFHKFLSVLFDAAMGNTKNTQTKLIEMQNNQFDRRSYQRMETLVSDANLKRPWNEHFEDDFKVLVGTASERDAYDLITFKAHDHRLNPRHQLGFERVGGAFLEAV